MDFIDIIMLIVLTSSVVFNILAYKKIEILEDKLQNERRKHLKYRTQLNSSWRDYADNEQAYQGIAGGDR